jgi:translation initiation factor 2 beta subunit (eIF-2beta)/eIF-5
MSEKLKPCPICGSTQTEVEIGESCGCWAECDSCGWSSCPDLSEEGAIKRWNGACYGESLH